MRRIAVINQRYGEGVNGGSEVYARKLAEHLAKYYKVDFLTSDALDYVTWKPYFDVGRSENNGVTIKRFHVKRRRGQLRFKAATKIRRVLGVRGAFLDKMWVREQGPYVPGLVRYINDHKNDYDAFVFVTYLYYPTAVGIQHVAEKAILVPTAHDEFCIYFPIYRNIFRKAAAIAYLTEEEKVFSEKLFENSDVRNTVATMAVDIPKELHPEEFRKVHLLDNEYIIYAGRIDISKGCEAMIRCFLRYIEDNPESSLDLVLIGNKIMSIPENERIHYLGFVSEQEKYDAMAGARFFWLPSEFESLSISTLESMAIGKPGLVNGDCKVLKGHAEKSGGAIAYSGDEECFKALAHLDNLTDDEYHALGENAKAYVKKYYDAESAEKKYVELIEYVRNCQETKYKKNDGSL